MDLNLKDRVAVVTGGAAGIGEAIARALAAEGCRVSILDRNEDAARKLAETLGGGTQYVAANVGEPSSVANAFAQLLRRHSSLDILVNAAGVLSTGLVADLPTAEWQRVHEVNLSGVLYCVKSAIPFMRQQRRGRIINIASVSAMRGGGSVGNTLYGATKAGVVALTMGLARELGPDGITANAIAPAVADTAMTNAALTEDVRRKIVARIPLGRLASLSDIADLATFLASDRASFITGTVIPVDGGILTT
jgi:NAD(P)-dependent dehydrogenase (short-subunit alcohol dehydrogenase family)